VSDFVFDRVDDNGRYEGEECTVTRDYGESSDERPCNSVVCVNA
jgi:hypothetical protein